MLNSFSQIFTFPSVQTIRKYQCKPRLSKRNNIVQKIKFKQSKRNFEIFEGILDFLATPIQNWALQYERSLFNYALNEWMYNEITSFSTSYKQKLSAGQRQNQTIRQLITQIRLQNSMSAPNFKKPKISLHNSFVLMTQYKLMQHIIYDLNTQELEMMIDGLSYIYFVGVGKVQNIGQVLSEQEIMEGIGGWGTIDELTCCIHYITTHTKLYKTYPQKQKYSLMKQIQILKMPYFIKVYDCLQENKKIDNIVNSIPMFMQFLQIFVKHKNNSIAGCQFVMNVQWLSGLGFRIIEIIQYNINKLLLVNNQYNDELSTQQLQIISSLENLNQLNDKQQSQIVLKLHKKAQLIRQTQGSINLRVLFSYAYHQLYTVNFLIKLTTKVVELSKSHYRTYKQTCRNVSKFLHKLFECVYKYQFNIPQASLTEVCEIIKLLSNQGQYVFGNEQKQVKGFDFLYSNQINDPQLKQFARNLQKSSRFGYYFNKKPKPVYFEDQQFYGQQISQSYNVCLETNQQSLFYYILSSIYDMKIDYLIIIYTVLKNVDKRYLSMLQFYFIKNQLLHFLIESQHQIQIKDKKNIKLVLNCIAYLMKGNLVAYAITDQAIISQIDQQNHRDYFLEDLRKNFPDSKQLILTVLADAITQNSKNPTLYIFCPQIMKKLLYPSEQQKRRDPNSSNKHQVWISYISNVILLELMGYKKRILEMQKKRKQIQIPNYVNLSQLQGQVQKMSIKYPFQQQINDWVTLIIFLHIDYTQSKKQELQQEMLLAQFVMIYLTTILSQAIKWKNTNEGQKMIDIIKMLQEWQNYYTDKILSHQNNQDLLQKQYGGIIKFLYMKRWNKKIIKAIKIYLQSMQEYNMKQRRQKRKSLQKVRSLKNLLH